MNRIKRSLHFSAKSVNEEKWELVGIASTPNSDRNENEVIQEGIAFTLPFPLLWQHDAHKPIGQVTKLEVSKKETKAHMKITKPTDDMPEGLKNRLLEAWHSVKSGLVTNLSIGINVVDAVTKKDSWGRLIRKSEIFELSLVTIPANADASITEYQSLEKNTALGEQKGLALESFKVKNELQVKNNLLKGLKMDKHLEDLKASKADAIEQRELLQKAVIENGSTKTAEQRKEFDNLGAKIKAFELEIRDIENLIESDKKTATPVAEEIPENSKVFSGINVIRAPEKLEKGIAFARFASVVGSSKGVPSTAMEITKSRFPQDKRLQHIFMSATAVGNTSDSGWAKELTEYNEISNDFIEFLRPQTIIGRFGTDGIPALRSAPFNVHIKGQNVGGTAGWVGEGKHKPVIKSGYFDTYLGWAKLSAISVATDELLRFSSPSAGALIRDDLASAVIQVMDTDFIQIAQAGATGVKPASITYNYDNQSAGSETDKLPDSAAKDAESEISKLWTTADASNYNASSAVYITTPAVARKLAGLTNAVGAKRFPLLTAMGGSIEGVRVITSNSVDSGAFILAFASEIYLADDGVVTLDVSREATLIMDTAPQVIYDGDATAKTHQSFVNMYQTNSTAFRAERYINWSKRRAHAVNVANATSWT